MRSPVVGASRTAAELGRAFPGVVVLQSNGEARLDGVPGTGAIVVTTPGAEPPAEGGYAAAILLDATVIRGVLLPATMKLLGDWNWYLPRPLQWLPEISHGAPVPVPA